METLALILAGGRGTRLDILSEKRSKPSVPFAGKYRIIDFTLSNCCNSQIYDIAILTQYLPMSLNEHIGVGKPWDLDRRDSGVTLLQPHNYWYEGTADAVLKNIAFIKRRNPKYVLILSGDHIYKMDYRKIIKQHIEKNADLTIACKIVPLEEASRFGIMETDKNLKIKKFSEKPKEPKSNLASMGIYVFNTDVLLEALTSIVEKELDFGSHIIPRLIYIKKVFAFEYSDYWKDVGTYESYLETSLELASPNAKEILDMYDPNWKVYTKSEELPAVKFGLKSKVSQSLISNGCVIDGEVFNSILSPGVTIKEGAIVRNSVLLNGTVIEENAILDNCILDKNCVVGKNTKIGVGDNYVPNEENPKVLSCGINVCGKGTKIPNDYIIERNCRIFPSAHPINITAKHIKSGTTLR
ncbi:MAG: glucose-1-phosphate adenylyltransferase [Erysipelotrichales bacterium]|nr:glucose-1-phosphate adenylyltransferase [Erysipelotrichales bacterium]